MGVESQFWNLVDEANRLDDKAYRLLTDYESNAQVDSNRMVEPVYVAIVQLVKDQPESREIFVRCFFDLVLWKRKAPWMLLPFCMRVLRMPEILEVIGRDQVEHPYGTAHYAARMNFWDDIGHAYTDQVWKHAIAFDYFEHELR